MSGTTALKNRTLWFDGDSTVEPDALADTVLKGMKIKKGIYVSEMTDEIKHFNRLSTYQLEVKNSNRPLSFDWNIPESYKTMNLRTYMLQRLEADIDRIGNLTESEIEERIERVELELATYHTHDCVELLRTAIYIMDTFREQNVVWGIGRGSSCSSYILYLAGVHDIDSVKFELDITDFLR